MQRYDYLSNNERESADNFAGSHGCCSASYFTLGGQDNIHNNIIAMQLYHTGVTLRALIVFANNKADSFMFNKKLTCL